MLRLNIKYKKSKFKNPQSFRNSARVDLSEQFLLFIVQKKVCELDYKKKGNKLF